jgi:hypothetical protein
MGANADVAMRAQSLPGAQPPPGAPPVALARTPTRRTGDQTTTLVALVALLSLLAPLALGAAGDELRNWFDDPFFVVRGGVRACPVPLGPLTNGDERRTQTHTRSERGTRCYLEGRCSRPNSYLYDQDIAAAVRARFAASRAYREASLWVTVQRRIVWIEGCVAPSYRSGSLERFIRDVPDVELVVVNVRQGPRGAIPYRRPP